MIAGKVIELCSTYNHGRFLAAMIDAAFKAKRPPDYLLVVDDCSTDNSREVLESKQTEYPRLIVRYNPANRGALRNVEDMIAEVDCDYLVLRSADDRDGEDLIDHGIKHLDAHPGAAFFGTDVAYDVGSDAPPVTEPAGVPGSARLVEPDRFTADFGGNMIHGAGIVFRTSAVRAIGGFPPQYAWHSDWFVLMSLAFTHGFVYEPIVGATVYLSSSSYNSTGTKNIASAQSVFAAMVDTLRARESQTLYAAFRRHAVFDMMGGRFRDFLRDYQGGVAFDLTEAWADPTIRRQRNTTGIPAVVRRAMQDARDVIATAARFYIYGAGLHTEIVLDILGELGLPSPLAIIATHPSGPTFVRGIPVAPLEAVEDVESSVVLISSKSFEGEMYQLARSRFPRARIRTVWGVYPPATEPAAEAQGGPCPVNQSYLAGLTDRLIKAGDVDDATALLGRVLQRDPENAFALCRLGMALFNRGLYNDAATHLTRALRTWDRSPETHLFLGLAQLAAGQTNIAIGALVRGIVLHAGYCQTVLSSVAEASCASAVPAVSDAFARASAEHPEDHTIRFAHGQYLSRLGRYDDAIVHLQHTRDSVPLFAPAYYELGVASCHIGDVAAALRFCQSAIYLDPLWHDRERLFGLLLEHRSALLRFIEETISLPGLRQMVSHLLAQSGPHFPSNCWLFNLWLNATQLEREGIENFKHTVNLNYFNWVPAQLDEQIEALELSYAAAPAASTFPRPPRAPASWSDADWGKYARFIHLLWRFSRLHDPLGLLQSVREPALGNPLTISVDGGQASQDLGNSALELNAALAGIPPELRSTLSFAELGAGYGRIPFLLLANFPGVRVTIIDIPPALYLSQWYLQRCFPQLKVFAFRPINRFEEVAAEFQEAQLRFLSADQAALLPEASFDLFVSVATLQEMTHDQVRGWIDQIDRLTRGRVYLKQWRVHFDDLNRTRVDYGDYPFPPRWRPVFSRNCPAQPRFIESCFAVQNT